MDLFMVLSTNILRPFGSEKVSNYKNLEPFWVKIQQFSNLDKLNTKMKLLVPWKSGF